MLGLRLVYDAVVVGITTAIWGGATFENLGLKQGTYMWIWPAGDFTEIFTIQIGTKSTEVPEPTTLAFLSVDLIGLGIVHFGRTQWSRVSLCSREMAN